MPGATVPSSEGETGHRLGRGQVIVDLDEPSNMIESSHALELVSVHICHRAEPALEATNSALGQR